MYKCNNSYRAAQHRYFCGESIYIDFLACDGGYESTNEMRVYVLERDYSVRKVEGKIRVCAK